MSISVRSKLSTATYPVSLKKLAGWYGVTGLRAILDHAWLGEATSDAASTDDIGGTYRRFTNGVLYRYTHDNGKRVVGAVPKGGVYGLWTRSHRQRGPFGYPVGLPEFSENKTVCQFEGGTITSRAEKPRQVMFYNTALIGVDVLGVTQDRFTGTIWGVKIVDKKVYGGRGRAKQLKVLIDRVSESTADVVVLAEMMGNSDRAQLIKAVRAKFPHSVEGPDEKDPEEDSGLLILSRHPLSPPLADAPHKGDVWGTVYRSCCGVDCWANKGASMVRVSPSDGPAFYVVGTHLQNGNFDCAWPTNAGVGTGAAEKREAQLRHLDSWIMGVRDLDLPVVTVGDFNIDANAATGREILSKNLPDADDLWLEHKRWLPATADHTDPITSPHDSDSNYEPGRPRRTEVSTRKGTRIDLALLDQGERITAHVTGMQVWPYELERGIDLSDHFAITADLGMSTVTHKLTRKVRTTTARLKYLHALELSDGLFTRGVLEHWSKKDPDEIDVAGRIHKGKPGTAGRPSARVGDTEITFSMGERHKFASDPDKTLVFDGTDDVHLEITVEEVDTAGPLTTDRTAIGRDRDVVAPKSSQLLHAAGGRRYAPHVMYGNGAEYVAIMEVDVALDPFPHRRERPTP
ncbi:endonuclease/exonuclease/phosphatase family protein [Nocardia pseudovaccinii]|uniref:endonuclease/exonuclease/phosphatase family protein n=1 Tax=Nocardia pseudovaccinii TaxID=189540 RepID=UPI003D8F0A54